LDNTQAVMERALGTLSHEVLDILTKMSVVCDYKAGSIIVREGDIEPIFYIIQDGRVAFTKKMVDGEQFLGVKTRGEFFGELGVLDHAPRAATVHAISDCKLIQIHEDTLENVLELSPSIARAIMRGIIRSVRDTDQITIAELQLKNNELARTLENLRAAQAELLLRERLKRDLEIAAIVHKNILPTFLPTVPGFEFASLARPAREIGGDLYDVMQIGEEHIGVVMADASGKSVQAAMYMAVVRALFLSESRLTVSPSEVAHRVHDLLLKVSTTADMFVTAFYATINYKTRYMRFIRGGHDRPVYYEAATDKIKLLDVQGRFLGLLPNLFVNEDSLTFGINDILVCYSDGVTDAVNPSGEMYGLERLRKIVEEYHHHTAKEMKNFIIEDIDRFRADQEQPDDLTLLVLKAI